MSVNTLIDFDRGLGTRFVAGADEAGRGCLAGPLVAAGVLFDYRQLSQAELQALATLNDSKQLTPIKREGLLPVVLAIATTVTVVIRTAAQIDSRGLHKMNLDALGTALNCVAVDGAKCLSDGFALPGAVVPHESVVHGDATSAAIAAASIVAKVTRDRFMRAAAVRHPGWGFDQHFGYSTAQHRDAIGQIGLSPLHRRSFASVAYTQPELAF